MIAGLPSGRARASSPDLPHLPSLDGVRGLAILLVLMHNLSVLEGSLGGLGRWLALVSDLGWIGVQLFFVLSGFLITRILLQTQSSDRYYRSFYARRVLRIFPLYFGSLVLFFVLWPIFHALPAGLEQSRALQWWYWLYLSNWSPEASGEGVALPHFWSLAVEEQFYFVWPFLVRRRSASQVLRLALWTAFFALVARAGLLAAGTSAESVYVLSPCRMDALALGAAAAALMQMPTYRLRLLQARAQLLWVAAAMFVGGVMLTQGLYARTAPLNQTLGYSVLSLVFMLVILAAAGGDSVAAEGRRSQLAAVLRWPSLRAFGTYSYGIYIVHKPLHDLVTMPWMVKRGWSLVGSGAVGLAYLAVTTGLCLMVAMLLYHGFEMRFLALKRYFIA
jgi:peptidoglycan/LPS O-acetylase OafA/YrhL